MARKGTDDLLREIIALKQADQELLIRLHHADKAGRSHWSAQLGRPGEWEYASSDDILETALSNVLVALKESIIP